MSLRPAATVMIFANHRLVLKYFYYGALDKSIFSLGMGFLGPLMMRMRHSREGCRRRCGECFWCGCDS